MIDGLLEAYRLKGLDRAGWVRVGIENPESVAAHSWGMSLLTLALLPDDLDRGLALAYCALHDLPECLAGDITPHDGVSPKQKHAAEAQAMAQLQAAGLPAHLAELWAAYERQADPESRFVQDIDKLDMALQALFYAQEADTHAFVQSAANRMQDARLLSLLDRIRDALRAQR